MKITSLIFGIIVMSLVMSSFGLFMADLSDNYGITYNSSNIALYDKLNETQSVAQSLHEKAINESEQDTGLADVIGGWVTKAVDSLKLTYRSVTSANEMIASGVEDLGLPKTYYTALVVIILVFVTLGVIISAMVKYPL